MKTTKGEVIFKAADGGDPDAPWFSPTTNPFIHGCCDCGLAHQVEYAFVDRNGERVDCEELREHGWDVDLALRFTRDRIETTGIRVQMELNKAEGNHDLQAIIAGLDNEVPMEIVSATRFAGVLITGLGRESLLKLVALLAAGKKEESRIITLL